MFLRFPIGTGITCIIGLPFTPFSPLTLVYPSSQFVRNDIRSVLFPSQLPHHHPLLFTLTSVTLSRTYYPYIQFLPFLSFRTSDFKTQRHSHPGVTFLYTFGSHPVLKFSFLLKLKFTLLMVQ